MGSGRSLRDLLLDLEPGLAYKPKTSQAYDALETFFCVFDSCLFCFLQAGQFVIDQAPLVFINFQNQEVTG